MREKNTYAIIIALTIKGVNFMYMYKRNIVVCILLSILTCGLYGLYWLACIANDINALEEEYTNYSGGMVVVLTILTCGLYLLYYVYMASRRIFYLFEDCGYRVSDNSIVNLLLSIASYFVPGAIYIAFAIMQSDINKIIDIRANTTYDAQN